MNTTQTITVTSPPGQKLNGLGMMVTQFLRQVFAESPSAIKDALRTRCVISMEMGKETAGTISFQGPQVMVENGIAPKPDLHIGGDYLDLSGVLSGKLNPVVGVLQGKVKIKSIPRLTRLLHCLRVMKILKSPPEITVSEEI